MEINDFYIGLQFFTGAGKWVCVDKGTHCVIASRLGQEPSYLSVENMIDPDYWWELTLVIFEPIDFGGCDLQDRFS